MAFRPFHRLPTEIRLQIWEYAIPSGVYVEFHLPRMSTQHIISRCSDSSVPPILQANIESRAVALQYLLILGTGSSRAYFNPEIDTVMVSCYFDVDFRLSGKRLFGEDVGLIKHMAYTQPYDIGWAMDPAFFDVFKQGLQSFTFLDLSDWENIFWPSHNHVREAMRSTVFRKEKLLPVEEVVGGVDAWQGRNPWCQMAKRRYRADGKGRELEVSVLKFPVPLHIQEDANRKEEMKSMKAKLDAERKNETWWGFFLRMVTRLGLGNRPKTQAADYGTV